MTRLNSSLRFSVAVALAWGMLLGLMACSRHKPEATISAFVPCGLVQPIQAVVHFYAKDHHKRVHCTFGTPIELLDKIEREGARPDLFISPGEREMKRLEKLGLIHFEDCVAFGEYDMVLIVPQKNPGKVHRLEDLAKASVRTIALAEPDINSTGYYAQQALENLGLWEKVKEKITSPRQAWHGVSFVAEGKADAGFSYDACPLRTAPGRLKEENVRIVETLPPASHDPILCRVVKLKDTAHPEECQAFIDYLLSEKIQRELAQRGVPNVRSRPPQEATAR